MNSGNHETNPGQEGPPSPVIHGMDPSLRSACEAIGEVIEFWGFKKDMGMIWTYLYLTAEQATAQEIREYFQISTGQTSTVLQGLVEWGVVAKLDQPGRQPDTYQAQTDLWPIITRVWRERELRMVLKTKKALEEAHTALRQKTRQMPLKDQKSYREAERRIADLAKLAGDGERAIKTFLELSRLDFNSVVRFPRLRA